MRHTFDYSRFNPATVMVVMMFLGYSVNFMDRQIVSVLVEPLKAELDLSDGQIGLLTGLSFAIFYSLMSLPIAALADRYSRKRIIVFSMAFWSVMTGLFGLAQSYSGLFLTRMAVGAGEAAFAPAAYSMIADYFPASRRGTAMAFGSIGAMVGTALGLVVGGYVAEHAGWRQAMFVAAIPGTVIAAAFGMFVREPMRGSCAGVAAAPQRHSFLAFRRNSPYVLLVSAASVGMFVLFACVHWFPAYLIRSHQMSQSSVGTILGVVLGGAGVASFLIGGYATDLCSRRDVRWGAWIPALGALAGLPLLAAALCVSGRSATLTLFGLGYFAIMLMNAPIIATIPSLVGAGVRARAIAVFMVMTTLAVGCGPTVAGFLSEIYRPEAGPDSLRFALMTLTPVLVIAPVLLFFAAPRFVGSCPVPAVESPVAVGNLEPRM